MNSYKIEELKEDDIFSENLLLDNEFLLLPAHCKIKASQLQMLKEWGFEELQSEGKIQQTIPPTVHVEEKSGGIMHMMPKPAVSIDTATEAVDLNDFLGSDSEPASTQKAAPQPAPAAETPKPVQIQQAQTKAKPAPEAAPAPSKLAATPYDSKSFEEAKKVYYEYTKFINETYTHYATNKTFDNEEIAKRVAALCTYIKNNRNNMLRIISMQEVADQNFLINHSMRSTIVAINIGLQLKMHEEKLVELGIACMLHEVGMIFLPPQLYMSDRQLSAPEKLMMNTHPIVSYNILKKANFSLNAQLAVLEHHERINGSGYPRHVSGDKISLYAKIIAVACSFEAITAPRSYKEERSTFEALVEMLRNSNRQYDGTIMKTLLYSISLYPIGVYVYLSNGKIAQVVDITPGSPRTPFVQVLGEEDKPPVQVDMSKLKIIRVLNKQEVADTLASLKKAGETN